MPRVPGPRHFALDAVSHAFGPGVGLEASVKKIIYIYMLHAAVDVF